MLTFAPLCEHHLPHSAQQHVQLPVAQFHSAAQSVSDKRPQRRQPVSVCLSPESLSLAEGHHDLAKCDVKGQRLHRQPRDDCSLLTPKGMVSGMREVSKRFIKLKVRLQFLGRLYWDDQKQ